ncbi:MAG: ABC-2 transporter permease [Anaerotruncus massiliensis (ex Togo et al. 2019)]
MLSVIRMDLLKLRSVAGAMFPLLIIVFFLSATLSVSAAVFLYVIVVYFFVYTPAAYDEQSKGDYLTGSLPVRREKLVAAKYLYDLAVVAGACLAALAAGGIGAALKLGRGGSVTGMLPVLILIGCAFTAFVQPLILGFGVTRARYWILAAYAFGVAAATVLGMNVGGTRAQMPSALPGWLAPLLILFGAALLAVSIHRAAALRPPPVHRLRRPAMRNVLLLCRTDWFRLAGLPRYSLVYLLILAGFSVSTHVAPIGYVMACYVLSATVVGFDDNSAAGLFTGTLPVSRAQIVWGKYFFCTAFLLLADGVVLLVNRAAAGLLPPSVNPLPIGSLLALQFCGAAVIIAVSLPLILLLGSIRARYGLVAIYMAVFFLLFRYASEAGRGGIPPLPSDAVSLLWLVGAAALLASALITCASTGNTNICRSGRPFRRNRVDKREGL